eukprot:1682433-Prymnesium_polylepis.1
MEQGMAQGEAPANMSDVRSFIEAHRASPDAEVAAAAEAAAKAWAEGPVQQVRRRAYCEDAHEDCGRAS